MITTITKYQATDGSEWNTAEAAEARENMITEADEALALLIPTPTESNQPYYAINHGTGNHICRNNP